MKAFLLSLLVASASAEPFAPTMPTTSTQLAMTWQTLQRQINIDNVVVNFCRHDPPNCSNGIAFKLIAIIDEAKQHHGLSRLGHLNRAVNEAIPGTRRDMPWLGPLDALANTGDCKNYAVVKYAALGQLGIAEADRELMIVRDPLRPSETHLIVIVRVEDKWLILDNRTMMLVDWSDAIHYVPLHTFNAQGARDFPLSGASK